MYLRRRYRLGDPNKKRNTVIFVVVLVILVFVLLVNGQIGLELAERETAQSAFQVHMIDVGQGDAVLVIADGHAMLVDAGDADHGDEAAAYLARMGIDKLDRLVVSHLHADHIGGVPAVLASVKAAQIAEPVCPETLLPTNDTFKHYLTAVRDEGAQYRTYAAGDRFKLGSAEVRVLAPREDAVPEQLNDTSLVLRVTYEDRTVLLTGDMENAEETALLEDYDADALYADVLKVAHHGSAYTTSEAFLKAVEPRYAFISCAKENDYGHPAGQTLDRLAAVGASVHITADEGSFYYYYDPEQGLEGVSAKRRRATT